MSWKSNCCYFRVFSNKPSYFHHILSFLKLGNVNLPEVIAGCTFSICPALGCSVIAKLIFLRPESVSGYNGQLVFRIFFLFEFIQRFQGTINRMTVWSGELFCV